MPLKPSELPFATDSSNDQLTKPAVVMEKTIKPVISYTQTTVVSVPKSVFRKNRLLVGWRNSFRPAYNMARTHVLLRMKSKAWSTLGIISANPSEGNTLTAINLALSIARDLNHTALLADFDLANPSICGYFEYNPPYGIGDYIFCDVPLKDILFNPGVERLVVIPAKEKLANTSELLSSPIVTDLVDEIKSRYHDRYAIFDLPPVTMCDDALALSSHIDAFLIVVEEGKTKKEELKHMVELFGKDKIIGTILNKSRAGKKGYY